MGSDIRILLVDDHDLFRESLHRWLDAEPGLRVVGGCASSQEALAILDREAVDLVLLDFDLGGEIGTAFQEEAKRRGFKGRVLVVTAGMSNTDAIRAIESGASGIFLKRSQPALLVQAIHQVARGDAWLDPGAMRAVVAGASGKPDPHPARLSDRERSVLDAVFEGHSNKEIAAKLAISEGSVKSVIQQLFDKTGVRTRSQLVRVAIERRLQEWVIADRDS
jgi:DNA-binding NarL/FixJ family response regulator